MKQGAGLGSDTIKTMRALQHFKLITRLVLVWWLLSIGAAVASPMRQTQPTAVVCSGGVMKVVVLNDEGSSTPFETGMHCPLCLAASAPPTVLGAVVPTAGALSYVVPYRASTHVAARTASPLPARGPPL